MSSASPTGAPSADNRHVADLPLLTARAQNRALLARQMLLERTAALSVGQALEHLVGLQAQSPAPPYHGLWSRVRDFDPHELGALLTDRRAVRMTLMRATVHLVTVQDALRLRPLMHDAIERSFRGTFRRRLVKVDVGDLARTARAVLEDAGEPLSGRDLALRVIERGVGHDLDAVRYAIGLYVPLIQVPPRGVWGASGQAKYVTLDGWAAGAGAAPDPGSAGTTLEDVVVRYLGAFGPAGVMDVQKWSGLTGCRAVLDRLRPRLVSFRSEGGQELFDLPDAPRPDAAAPAPVRLLGEFDNVLLSHADRQHVAPHGALPWMDPSAGGRHVSNVLVDGFLRAVWWIEREGRRRATLAIRPLERLSRAERAEVKDEARRMVEFGAADAATRDVRVAAA